MSTENLFWPLVLSLISWACIAIVVYAPWYVTAGLSLLAWSIGALVAYGYVRLPTLVWGREMESVEVSDGR